MKLDVIVGLIGSGKSTFTKQRAAEGAIIVNDDAIVLAVHAGDYNLYSEDLKPLYKSVENTMISMAAALGRDVVIDRPNVTVKTRARYIAMGRSFDYDEINAIVFPVRSAQSHAMYRFNKDNRGRTYQEWLDVATMMFNSYQSPSSYEGFDNLIPSEQFMLEVQS